MRGDCIQCFLAQLMGTVDLEVPMDYRKGFIPVHQILGARDCPLRPLVFLCRPRPEHMQSLLQGTPLKHYVSQSAVLMRVLISHRWHLRCGIKLAQKVLSPVMLFEGLSR